MLSAAMALEVPPGRAAGAPAVSEGSRAGTTAELSPAKVPQLEHAPAADAMPTPDAADGSAELAAKSTVPLLLAEVAGSDGSLRASLARMMAAEHRWPAPTLASDVELPANLASGAPRPRSENLSDCIIFPSPSFRFSSLGQRCVMEVAVCALGGDAPPASSPLCASPLASAAACPLPAAFLPPAMTLAELTALATDPDALKAFVNGTPSSAAGTSVMPPGMQGDGSPLQSDLASGLASAAADGGSPNSPSKRRGPRSATSKFRGVSCYKRTGRWESHIWSNGKQVHLGSFRAPEEAASAYDKAAIMFRGWEAETNAPTECYRDDEVLAFHMQNDTTEEYVQWLRRGCKEVTGPVTPKPIASLPAAGDCPTPTSQRKTSRTSARNSPGNGKSATAAAAAAASAASFGTGILPSIPLMEMCHPHAPLSGAALEEQHLLLGSVTAPLHGDGMATLVCSGAPSDGSALLCNGYSGFVDGAYAAATAPPMPTHTSAGVPLASLVAAGPDDSAAADGGDAGGEAADHSFAEFAASVWPKLVE